jgi:hypothetical protein
MCVRSRSALRDRRRRSRQPAERRSTKTTVSEVEPASTGVERSSALVVSWVIHSSAFENVLSRGPVESRGAPGREWAGGQAGARAREGSQGPRGGPGGRQSGNGEGSPVLDGDWRAVASGLRVVRVPAALCTTEISK